jgi:hypothetical protein
VTTPSMMGMGNESPASPEVLECETTILPINLDQQEKQDQVSENARNFPSGDDAPAEGDAILIPVNGKCRVN